MALCAEQSAAVARAQRFARILNHHESMFRGQLHQGIHVGAVPQCVHQHDRTCLASDRLRHASHIHVECVWLYIHEDGLQTKLDQRGEGRS